jgi:RimK family alpha-L-glutamate ligase
MNPKKYAIIGPTLKGKISSQIEHCFLKKNIQIEKLVPKQISIYVQTPSTIKLLGKGKDIQIPDVALIRGVGSKIPSKIFFRLDWMWILENSGVRLVNSRKCLEIATNKMLTSQVLNHHGIPTPQTILCESFQDAINAYDLLDGDVVVKPLYGARGQGITRLSSRSEAIEYLKAMEINNEVYYLQKFMTHNQEDFRLLVIGDEIVGSMKRKSNSWKTNLSQGGKALKYKASDIYTELAIKSAKAVDGEIIGVNAVPGYIGLQSVLDIDINEKIVDYILSL